MSDKDKCRKCRGSGEAFGGVCFDCGGSGTVSEVRYQTTPSRLSKNPGLRAEREAVKAPFIPPNPELVAKQLEELTALVKFEVEKDEPVVIDKINCDHEFHKYHYGPQCTKCRIFEHQFYYSINVTPRAGIDGVRQ